MFYKHILAISGVLILLTTAFVSDAAAKPVDVQPTAVVMKTMKLTHTYGTVGKPQKTTTRTLNYRDDDTPYSVVKRFCESEGFGTPPKNTDFQKRIKLYANHEIAKYEVERFMWTHDFASDWKESAKSNCTKTTH